MPIVRVVPLSPQTFGKVVQSRGLQILDGRTDVMPTVLLLAISDFGQASLDVAKFVMETTPSFAAELVLTPFEPRADFFLLSFESPAVTFLRVPFGWMIALSAYRLPAVPEPQRSRSRGVPRGRRSRRRRHDLRPACSSRQLVTIRIDLAAS